MLFFILFLILLIFVLFLKQKENYKNINNTKLDYKISLFFTGGLCEEAKNCIKTIENVGLKKKLLVHTLDAESYNCIKNQNLEIKNIKTNLKKEANFGTKDFYEIVLNKFKIIKNCLQTYNNIIVYSDTDIVFLKDITHDIEIFNKSDYDIMIQDDSPDFKNSNNLCTGFMFLKPSKVNIKFIDNILEKMEENYKNLKNENNGLADQRFFNEQLKKNKVKVGMLDLTEYPNGSRYFNNINTIYKSNKPKIIHNNYIVGTKKKIERFKKHNLWFV